MSQYPSEKRVVAAGVSLGAITQLAQILILRELVAVWGGNELAIAVILGTWLLGTVVGAAAGSCKRWHDDAARLQLLLAGVSAVLLPAVLYAARGWREPRDLWR